MKNINCLLVRSNGLTISFQAESWVSAAKQILEQASRADAQAREGFGSPVVLILTSTGSSLEKHMERELREALEDGTLAKIDSGV